MEQAEIIKISATVLALVIAIVGHEIMHGWVAYKYGDTTAKDKNRLSINPIHHIDPIGTILVPAMLYFSGTPFLFGWAKPVPINMRTVLMNGGTNGAVAVALAGITYNFVLAAISAVLFSLFMHPESMIQAFLAYFLFQSVLLNVLLGVFNLWPIPPLDGANAVRYLAAGWKLKPIVSFYDKIYPYGMIFIIIILMTPLRNYLFQPVTWVAKLLL